MTKYRAHRQMGMRRIFYHYSSQTAYRMWKNREARIAEKKNSS